MGGDVKCAHCGKAIDRAVESAVCCPECGNLHERCTTDRSGGFNTDSVCWECGSSCVPFDPARKGRRNVR